MIVLPPDALSILRGVRLDLGSLIGRCERRADEDARGLPWRLATERPTPESTALALRAAAAILVAVADDLDPPR